MYHIISYYLQFIYIYIYIYIYLFIVYHLALNCHILSIIVLLMRIQSVGHGSHSFTQKKSTGPVLRRGFWPIAFAKEAPPQHMGISRNEGRAIGGTPRDPKGSSTVVFTGKSSGFVVPPRSTTFHHVPPAWHLEWFLRSQWWRYRVVGMLRVLASQKKVLA